MSMEIRYALGCPYVISRQIGRYASLYILYLGHALYKERQISKHSFHYYFKQRCIYADDQSNLRKPNTGYYLKKRKLGWGKFYSITRAPNTIIKSTDDLSRSHDKKQSPAPRKAACLPLTSIFKMTTNGNAAATTILIAVLLGCLATSVHCKALYTKRVIFLWRMCMCVYIYSDAMQCCDPYVYRWSSAYRCHRRARGGVDVAATVLLQGVWQRALRLLLLEPVHADDVLGH
jgi:hypothetical protein